MHEPAHLLSFKSAIEARAAAGDGTVGLDDFFNTVIGDSKKWAREKLDTEEERDAVNGYFVALADQYVAPRFPVIWGFVRESIVVFLDKAIDNVPMLLASAQASDPNSSVA